MIRAAKSAPWRTPGHTRRALGSTAMDINGASAIVTGGASGIGAAVARQLATAGAKVVVTL